MQALLLALALVSPDEQTARKHFEQAEKWYTLGKFQDALAEYEAAYAAKPLPGFLFNVGQCYRNLGNYSEAVSAFRSYLREKPDAKNRDAVEGLIRDLEKKLAEQPKASPDLVVHADPSPPPPASPNVVAVKATKSERPPLY